MKIYVANLTNSENRVYIEGIRHRKTDQVYSTEVFRTNFPKDEFTSKVKSVKFPFVLDISLVKGKGAVINNAEKV